MHKFLFYNTFTKCIYMFLALCAHHQEVKIVLYSIWYHYTYRWPSGAHWASNGHLQIVQLFEKYKPLNSFFNVYLWTVHSDIFAHYEPIECTILLSIYFNKKLLHVSRTFTAHHQEVLVYIYSNCYVSCVYVSWLLAVAVYTD